MANDSNAPSYQYGGLNIQDFVKASLVSVAKAQHAFCTEQTRLLLEACFTQLPDGTHEPVMVTMHLKRNFTSTEGTDTPQTHTISTQFYVPLIALIPLTSLGVDNVKLDFKIELTSQYTAPKPYRNTFTNQNEEGHSIRLIGKIAKSSSDHEGKSETTDGSHLHLTMEAKNIPLSRGLLSIIDLYSNAVHPVENTAQISTQSIQKT